MSLAFRLVLAAMLFSTLLACAGPSPEAPPPAGPAVRWEGRSAAAVLAELRREQDRIRDLSAAFSLSVDPPPEGRPSSMNGVILFSRGDGPTRFRITALGPFGRTFFDMVRENGRLTVYVPSRDTAYRGTPEGAVPAGGGPEPVFADLFADLSEVRAAEDGVVVRENGNLLLPLEDGDLVLDPAGGLLRAWRRDEAVIEYGGYVQPSGGPAVPTRVLVRKRDGSLRVDCRLREVSLEPPPDGAFELPIKDSTTVRPLEALER